MKKIVLTCMMAGGLPGAAMAQADGEGDSGALALPAVTVTGFRGEAVEGVSGSVSVLTGEELAVRLSPNPADQLRAVPGVAVSRSGGPGSLTQVRMRGAEANHTLVLLDGIEVSDPVTGETDFGLLTGIGAARIEVLRGEASSIYGSDAVGGVVSVTTGSDTGVKGQAEAGSYETFRADLSSAGTSGNGVSFGGAVSVFSTGGVDTSGSDGETDGSEVQSAMGQVGFDLGGGWAAKALVLGRRSTAQSDADSDFDGRLDDSFRETVADQILFGAGLSGETGPVAHRLRASFGSLERENTSETGLLDTSTGERLKLDWMPSVHVGGGELTGLAGWEREVYRREDAEFGGLTDAGETFEAVGLAAEYRRTFSGVDLAASARQDFNDGRFEDAATWRIGAGWQAAPGTRLRASAGTGVKNPTFTELFGFFPGSFSGNPDLKPETSRSAEIGWDQKVGPATVSMSLFSAELENEIFTAFNPDFTSTARNRASTSQRRGAELAVSAALTPDLNLRGQVTRTQSENDAGDEEVRVPEVTASLTMDWATGWRGVRLGAALDLVGEQADFDFSAFPARRVALDAYTLVSASADFPLTKRWSVTVRGENLLDEEAVDVFGFNTPGAAGYMGLKLR